MSNQLKLRGIFESGRRSRASGPGVSRLPRAASLHLFTYAGADRPYNISRVSRGANRTNRVILRFSTSAPVSASPKNGSARARYRRFSVNGSFEAIINAFLGASGVQ
jgi:hypothetical protein